MQSLYAGGGARSAGTLAVLHGPAPGWARAVFKGKARPPTLRGLRPMHPPGGSMLGVIRLFRARRVGASRREAYASTVALSEVMGGRSVVRARQRSPSSALT